MFLIQDKDFLLGLAKEIFKILLLQAPEDKKETVCITALREIRTTAVKTFPRTESPGVGASVTHTLLPKKSLRKISVLDLEQINKWQLWERLGCLLAFVITLLEKIGYNSRGLS